MIEWVVALLEALTSSPWFLPLVFAVALADAVFPVVPSETALIVGGVAAGFGDLSLVTVVAAGALGSMAGDSLAYEIGHRFEGRIRHRVSTRMRARMEWASRALAKRAGAFILSARFIPGGRTAITVTSGLTRQPRARFSLFVVVAGVVWATYASSLGFFFGRRFQDDHALAFLWAFGVAVVIVGLVEAVRWLIGRASVKRSPLPGRPPSPSSGDDGVEDDPIEVA